MSFQLKPDWTMSLTAERIGEEFDVEFRGSGIYPSKDGVLVIIAQKPISKDFWVEDDPPKTVYSVHVYSCNINETIFGTVPPHRI